MPSERSTTDDPAVDPDRARIARLRPTRRALLLGAAGLALGAHVAWEAVPRVPAPLEASHPGRGEGRILVAYDSQYSTTGGVANALGAALAALGPQVDVRFIGNRPSAAGYSAVVIGAPVHADTWKSGATEWMRAQRELLATVPHALFLTSMSYALDPDRTAQHARKTEILTALADGAGLRPVSCMPFAGAVDTDLMGAAAGAAYMAVSRTVTFGDYRDWGAITAWGLELGPRLGLRGAA